MSDFSSAIMFNTSHKEIALKHTEDGVYLVKLNDTWLCRLSENDFCGMMHITTTFGQGFRQHPATDSDDIRPWIPTTSGHGFRWHPAWIVSLI